MRKKRFIFAIGVLITGLFLLGTWNQFFRYFHLMPRLNNIFYDLSFKLFYTKKKSDTIVIVDVDEKSLSKQGKWPWSRDKLATIVKNLNQDGAAVIAFDILFPEKDYNAANIVLNYADKNPSTSKEVLAYLTQHTVDFDNDALLAKELNQSNVVLGMVFNNDLYRSTGKLGPPILKLAREYMPIVPRMKYYLSDVPPLVDAARYTGFVTTIPDEDGILRRSPLLIEYDHALYPSLDLAAAKMFLMATNFTLDISTINNEQVLLGIKLGNIYIPTDAVGNILISYIGPAHSFPYISATDVLNKNFAPQTFRDKLVFIGASAAGIGDVHSTPLQAASFPGCEVHANISESILSQNFLISPLWMIGLERVLIVVIGLFFTIIAMYSSVFGLVILAFIEAILVIILQAFLWAKGGLVLPHIILPTGEIGLLYVANLAYGYIFETSYRKRLHDIYGQYASSAYIDKMLEHPEQHTLEGRSKMMTVLFADVRNFTSISESLDAIGVKNFLNQLFTALTEVIFEYKGTIDKYVGDMIMAFWNDPLDDTQHPLHATEAALDMTARVKALESVFATYGLRDVRIGIGINTGNMHVGDMGSKYRKTYTVLGDSVNLASRLEGANKFYGTSILLPEETKNNCPNIVFRFIDRVCVKGRHLPINIYEPLAIAQQLTPIQKTELNLYNQALKAYDERDFAQAAKLFSTLKEQYQKTMLYTIYLTRSQEFLAAPPPPDWDRVCYLTEK